MQYPALEQRRPAENRVERRPHLVRDDPDEIVFRAIGYVGVETGSLLLHQRRRAARLRALAREKLGHLMADAPEQLREIDVALEPPQNSKRSPRGVPDA